MIKNPEAQHTPLRPARKDLAEICFFNQWRSLNTDSPSFLPAILGQTRCSIRSARIAASFIVWLGSNAGAVFIAKAKDCVQNYSCSEHAYLATWALTNQRRAEVNGGVRAIEVILSPNDLFAGARGLQYARVRAEEIGISLADMDVVESLVSWLSTPHADAFVASCLVEYQTMRALERSKHNLAGTVDQAA